jgi:hypothetical protein
MATINTAVDIDIKVNGQQTVQQAAAAYEDLGDAVAKTQLKAEELAHQFGINDARTQEAIKTAAKYKAEMEQLDFAIEGAKGGSDQLFRASQGVLGGFEAAAGAAALFGGQSEALEATLVKLQGAMALSQGLKDFNEFKPAIIAAATSLQTRLVGAFTKVKAAITSTGIGAMIIGIGVAVAALAAYWDDIMDSISGVSDEQKDLLETQKKSTAEAQSQLDAISEQENILKLQGKTDEEILQMKIKQTEVTIANLRAQLETQEQVKKAQVDASTRNKNILQGIIRFITSPLSLLLKGVDLITEGLVKIGVMDKAFNLEESFTGGIARMMFDPEEVASEADKSINETKKGLTKLENTLAGYRLTEQKNAADQRKAEETEAQKRAADGQKAAEKAIQDKEKELAEKERLQKEFEDRLEKAESERLQREKEEYDKSLKNLDEYYNQKQLALNKSLIAGTITEEDYAKKSEQIELDKIQAIIQVNQDYADSSTMSELELSQKQIEINKQRNEAIKEQDEALAASKQELYDNTLALGDALISLIGDQTKVGKGLALAQIAADTARALSGALANANSPTPDNIATGGLAGIAKYITLATQILGNAKRAKDVLKGGGSVSVPTGGGSTSVPEINTRQFQTSSLGQDFTGETRVYVTEGDITKTQRRRQTNQRVSVIGG